MPMNASEAPAWQRVPGWLKLLLIVSLTANLVVIGVVAGYELRGDDRRRGSSDIVAWVVEMLPEERRAAAEAHLALAQEAFDAADSDRGTRIDAVLAALRAEPYDPAAVEAAMAEFGASRRERWAVFRERLASLLDQLTPEERAAFADRFDERMSRWRERRSN
jgi:uncharacterized membrane protein